MKKKIPIGIDDFKKIINGNYFFVDKTMFIKEIIDDGSEVVLFPRPRRFGKTLNMSMLSYYFDIEEDSKDLFKGLDIMKQEDIYLQEMNNYPVVYLTLKETAKENFQEFKNEFKKKIVSLYTKNQFLLSSSKIGIFYKEYFNRCLEGQEDVDLQGSIAMLVDMLSQYYNKQVIVLMDEYDAPIISSYTEGYYDDCIRFMRSVFSSTFKNNLNLKKGVITGIFRISKESLFSTTNNINVYNITDGRYSKYFGFTEEETKKVLKEYELEAQFDEIKKWYDGYNFCDETIYNPWSILKYLNNVNHLFQPYWVNTGGVSLLKELILRLDDGSDLVSKFNKLLDTGYIENINVNLNMEFTMLRANNNNIWTLFMLAGYLTPKKNDYDTERMTLVIPNYEVKKNLELMCSNWLSYKKDKLYDFAYMLYQNNFESFRSTLEDVVLTSFSYYDVPDNDTGENFYHAFTMGLLYSSSEYYEITSNKEAGLGRYDLLLKPYDKTRNAYIIEFKVTKDGDFDKSIKEAFMQIEEKKYDVDLKKSNYKVIKIAIAFHGKQLKMEVK